jgi:endonuclease YncB( thermonuclease family)
MHVICAIALTLLASFLGQTAVAAIVGAAFVQEDGSLQVKGRRIQLFGIYIPPTDRSCQTLFRPVRCSSRAALALDFKIQGFVHCEVKAKHRDSSLIGRCYVDRNAFSEGEDLSAYLISLGWAAALPDAPYEYHVLEKIARQRGLGVWGFPVNSIQ